ncbi:glycosyltransferase family 2 protein [Kozakia baliensis]|uniref:glycosyltransferase family 2 protein n=1 Tax=Kozakia baliensis TaxID=153496 RepID=UPI000496B2CD|nr:glycosyltransferase family 2 protein [Kozakia baliensis]
MPSVAAALFVKNEADDIAWWISHHLACGFDALLIFDDHSEDGTWEIIQTAKSLFKVKAHRYQSSCSELSACRFDAYREAISLYRDDYDWIGFFDCDEYFYPVSAPDVRTFLSNFPEAHGVAVHWCIYGSNGHIAKPRLPPIAAYSRHAEAALPDHRLYKSFIRPQYFRGEYIDPYRWDIEPNHYVNACGDCHANEGANPPLCWERAKILHYISRSATHYAQRLAQRQGGYQSNDVWEYFDRNDIEDTAPLCLLEQTRHYASAIAQAGLIELFWQIKRALKPPNHTDLPVLTGERANRVIYDALRFATLHTEDGAQLFFNRNTLALCAIEALQSQEALELTPAILAFETPHSASRPCVFIMAPFSEAASCPPNTVLYHWLPYLLEPKSDDFWYLRSPIAPTALYVETTGFVQLDGEVPTALRLKHCPTDTTLEMRTLPYVQLTSRGHTLPAFLAGIERSAAPHPAAIAAAIAFLPPADQKKLSETFIGHVPYWLIAE